MPDRPDAPPTPAAAAAASLRAPSPATLAAAEAATLAAAACDPAVAALCRAHPPAWWSVPAHALLAQALQALYDRGVACTPAAWAAEAARLGLPDAAARIAALPPPRDETAVITSAYLQRALRHLGQWLAQPHRAPPEQVAAQAWTRLHHLLAATTDARAWTAADAAHDALATAVQGLPRWWQSGLPTLDAALASCGPGDFVVLGGRPSQGKTAFALQVAAAMAAAGRSVVFCTWEMSPQALAFRLLAQQAPAALSRLLAGAWLEAEGHALHAAAARLQRWRFVFLDVADLAPPAVAARVWRQAARWGAPADVVVCDYLQIIPPPTPQRSREQAVAAVSHALKQWARRERRLVIACAQIRRQANDRPDGRPALEDLRESGAIEADADAVILLHRPDPQAARGEVLLAKHRQGPTGVAYTTWDAETLRFLPAADPPADPALA